MWQKSFRKLWIWISTENSNSCTFRHFQLKMKILLIVHLEDYRWKNSSYKLRKSEYLNKRKCKKTHFRLFRQSRLRRKIKMYQFSKELRVVLIKKEVPLELLVEDLKLAVSEKHAVKSPDKGVNKIFGILGVSPVGSKNNIGTKGSVLDLRQEHPEKQRYCVISS